MKMKKIFPRVFPQPVWALMFLTVPALSQKVSSQNEKSTNAAADSGAYFRSFDGTKIYYEVRGSGETVLLVHGFIVNGQSWKRTELYKDLLIAGYKVIILDQRGNGISD